MPTGQMKNRLPLRALNKQPAACFGDWLLTFLWLWSVIFLWCCRLQLGDSSTAKLFSLFQNYAKRFQSYVKRILKKHFYHSMSHLTSFYLLQKHHIQPSPLLLNESSRLSSMNKVPSHTFTILSPYLRHQNMVTKPAENVANVKSTWFKTTIFRTYDSDTL